MPLITSEIFLFHHQSEGKNQVLERSTQRMQYQQHGIHAVCNTCKKRLILSHKQVFFFLQGMINRCLLVYNGPCMGLHWSRLGTTSILCTYSEGSTNIHMQPVTYTILYAISLSFIVNNQPFSCDHKTHSYRPCVGCC